MRIACQRVKVDDNDEEEEMDVKGRWRRRGRWKGMEGKWRKGGRRKGEREKKKRKEKIKGSEEEEREKYGNKMEISSSSLFLPNAIWGVPQRHLRASVKIALPVSSLKIGPVF